MAIVIVAIVTRDAHQGGNILTDITDIECSLMLLARLGKNSEHVLDRQTRPKAAPNSCWGSIATVTRQEESSSIGSR